VRSDRHRFGMLIDDIINPEEIVVKPLGEHFSELTIFSGAAILGDGEAVLILDVPGIARFTNLQSNMREYL
jgi:two-component system chemotaxis sensor kinase CheA